MQNTRTFLVLGLVAVIFAPTLAQANQGDFAGGVAIGSSYAGVDAAPSNGLIVQGEVGIGNSLPSAPLDVGMAGTTTGAIVLEGGSSGYVQIQPAGVAGTWTLTLPSNAGSNGYVLSTDGTGVTSWIANGGGGSTSAQPPGGRLSLSSTSAVMTADATAATTIYYLPYVSEIVPIYNGSQWQELDFGSSGISLTLNPAEEVAGSLFDVYVLDNSGSPVLCAMNWGGTTARSTTAGGTSGSANASVTQLNGLWVNNAAISSGNCYNGTTSYAISQNQGTLLGAFYTPTAASSSLASTITGGTTSLSLSTTAIKGPGLISVDYYEALDSTTSTEYVLVTGGWNTTTQTVVRGQLGTSAIGHSSGKPVAVAGGQNVVEFQAISGGLSGGTGNLVGLSNIYNTVTNTSMNSDNAQGITYSTAAVRIYDNSTNNETYYIDPLQRIAPLVSAMMVAKSSNTSTFCDLFVGRDSTSAPINNMIGYNSGTTDSVVSLVGSAYPVLGLHYFAPLVFVNNGGAGTCTYLDEGSLPSELSLTIPY